MKNHPYFDRPLLSKLERKILDTQKKQAPLCLDCGERAGADDGECIKCGAEINEVVNDGTFSIPSQMEIDKDTPMKNSSYPDKPILSERERKMKKLLQEGECRRIHPGEFHQLVNSKIKIEAHCVDNDTPFVNLTIVSMPGDSITVCLEDVLVIELTKMLRRALYLLPTSK